ncbi:MAG TPA: acetylornithine deacetylase [Pyrinomonadaceae bacterium]|jgi:acetylornithine deacetylase
MTLGETLAELVGINSVSENSNLEIIKYLSARAERAGMRVRLLPYTDERGVEKLNLIAVTGTESFDEPVELALVGHTDTVPFDAAWTEALNLTERDARLYGRGACDTKAYVAAALTVAESMKNLRRPLALIFTADEEVGCLGAKRLEEARLIQARYAIVGEPTSLRPMRAGKGYCLAEVRVAGREGHSAYPATGASAIFRACRLVTRLERIAEKLKEDARAAFEPPHTTLNVGLIHGGTAKNIIAGECRFTLEWRPVPGQSAERVLELVGEAVEEEKRLDADFACEVSPLRLDEGMETPADSRLVRFLEGASGNAAGTIAFGTEAPQMIALGAEAVVFGPGDIRVAHRTGEFVPVDELHRCAEILRRAVEHFCT